MECDLHTDNPNRGVGRAVTFDRYIGKVAQRLSADTLLLFTADHSFDCERYVNNRRWRAYFLEESAAKIRRTEVRPICTRRAMSDLLTPARCSFRQQLLFPGEKLLFQAGQHRRRVSLTQFQPLGHGQVLAAVFHDVKRAHHS